MQTVVPALIEAMTTLVHVHNFDLLKRYPSDLLVHDRNMLGEFACPGTRFAWVLGHAHTHLVTLGLHPDENNLVDCFTSLCSSDRFFVIHVRSGSTFNIEEVTREEFRLLKHTRVPYSVVGSTTEFTLCRESRVGHASIKRTGAIGNVEYQVALTPYAGATAADIAALKLWASHRVRTAAGTFFVNAIYTEMPVCEHLV